MMPRFTRFLNVIILCASLSSSVACLSPDPFLEKKYGLYNFKDDGFLTPNILQTRGRAAMPSYPGGIKASRRFCLETALETAYRKTLRILLHIRFDVREGTGKRTGSVKFKDLFPREFSDRDYIRAELSFAPLLKKGFIALQDARSSKFCSVVFRIIGSDLPDVIRRIPVDFSLESIGKRHGRRKSVKDG